MALTSYIGGMILFGLSHTVTTVFLSSCLGFGTRMAQSLLSSIISQVAAKDSFLFTSHTCSTSMTMRSGKCSESRLSREIYPSLQVRPKAVIN